MSPDITPTERYEAGLQVRREVLGEEYVTRALANADEFTGPLQELVSEYCWGAVWIRPELSRRDRSMINLAMLAALGRSHELATHVRAALTNGVTPVEIREVLLQATIYAGVPAGVDAFRVAAPIIAEAAGK
ncbi:carboxymuconolactone decarboxylase family protein [Nocardia goodfellowii]